MRGKNQTAKVVGTRWWQMAVDGIIIESEAECDGMTGSGNKWQVGCRSVRGGNGWAAGWSPEAEVHGPGFD